MNFSDNNNYVIEVTDLDYDNNREIKKGKENAYLGSDGTVIGTNGGDGFSADTLYPSITKFEVNPITEDGSLKINIQTSNTK